MKSNYLLIVVLFLSTFISGYSQDGSILWQRTIGGSQSDFLFTSTQTSDDGYLLGGSSYSSISGEKEENSQGSSDFWVVKLDSSGEIEWQNTIGGADDDFLYTLEETADGGYIIGGASFSNISGDKTENSNGGRDFWVVKLTNAGSIEWQNTIGGNEDDVLNSIVASNNGGYLLSGYSSSNISGDKTENSRGGEDYWIVKIDDSGNIDWDKTYGGGSADLPSSLVQATDSGYLIGGISLSGISGDKIENNLGGSDYWVIRLNNQGEIVWQNTLGGINDDNLNSVNITSDGGFVLGGHSSSDMSNDKTENSIGVSDYWIVKLNNTGTIIWDNTIGGTGTDELWSVSETTDNGFIIGGNSNSYISGDKGENSNGESDYWVLKLNTSGQIDWQNTIGGEGNDLLRNVEQTSNGNYTLAGGSSSNISGDKDENSRGSLDFWFLKLNGTLGLQESEFFKSIRLYPNPANNLVELSSNNVLIDKIKLFSTNGELVQTIEGFSGNKTIDVSQLATGVYFLQISGEGKVITKKFVKE